jgi:hypothetical protein
MRRAVLILLAALSGACASAPEPVIAWVRADLTADAFVTDSAACAEEGASVRTDEAGNLRADSQSDYARAGAASSNDVAPIQSAGAEVNTNMYDVAALSRYNAAVAARNQREAQERAAAACMSARGYRAIQLTPEEAARIEALPEGSAERAQALREIVLAH